MRQVLSLTEPELDWLIKATESVEVDNPTEQEIKDDLTVVLGTLKVGFRTLANKGGLKR